MPESNLVRVRRWPSRRRGAALVLALIAVAVAVIASVTFLHAQATSTGIASNLERRAKARAAAESGLDMAIAYVRTHGDWRTRMHEGVWVDGHDLGSGAFTVIAADGGDEDGDGITDGDGDLADDPDDPVTLTAIGSFEGVTHAVTAVVSVEPTSSSMLMVVSNADRLDLNEERRLAQFKQWHFNVALVDGGIGDENLDEDLAAADVVYVSERADTGSLASRLRATTVGIVSERRNAHKDLWVARRPGRPDNEQTQVAIVDDSHAVTRTIGGGVVDISRSPQSFLLLDGDLAPGAEVLGTRAGDSSPSLVVLDAGDLLLGGDPSPGRRLVLPWGHRNFNWSDLTAAGLTLVRQALLWASEPTVAGQVAMWRLDEASGTVASDAIGGLEGVYRNGVSLGETSSRFADGVAGFDGRDDFIEVPHDPRLLLDQGTVTFWFRSDDVSRRQGLVSKDAIQFGTGGHLSISTDSGRVAARLESGDDAHEVRSGALRDGIWYHVVFTFGPAGMRLYLDGELAASDAYAGGLGTSSGGAGNFEPLAFGVLTSSSREQSVDGWSNPLLGQMRDVRVVDRALPPADIGRLLRRPTYIVRWRET